VVFLTTAKAFKRGQAHAKVGFSTLRHLYSRWNIAA
jgi:hypothetical protein